MMTKLIELTSSGVYKNDYIVDGDLADATLPEHWTADIPPDGMYLATYVDGVTGERGEQTGGQWVDKGTPPPLTPEQILQAATAQLNALTRQSTAQITALSGRISVLDWLINIQTPEDQEEAGEEYTAPTPADVAELAALKTRYTKWNSYSVKLGKVKTLATWPANPTWPVMPEPYTSETSVMSAPTA